MTKQAGYAISKGSGRAGLYVLKRQVATIGVVSVACGLAASPALTCADYIPDKTYSLIQPDEVSNVPFLAPSNDSRANLLLLLADTRRTRPRFPVRAQYNAYMLAAPQGRYAAQTPFDFDTLAAAFDDHPVTPGTSGRFIEGAGDRCRSNAAGADGILVALKSSTVPAAEKVILTSARTALAAACNTGKKTTTVDVPANAIRSVQGKEFAAYMVAAAQFYAGDFGDARQGFASLAGSDQPWLKEAAHYMVARVDMNAATAKAFGQWGEFSFDAVNGGAVARAGSEFQAYLHDYPQGTYSVSARGLMRRVAWLSGDNAGLADMYDQAFTQTAPKHTNISNIELVDEIDNKLLTQDVNPANIHEPKLLAALDLLRMRGGYGAKPLARPELDAQRPAFAGQMELYDYLVAAYAFYNEKNPAAALKILGRSWAAPHMSYLRFSAQVLQGLALEALHKSAAARAHWLALIPLAEPVLQRPAIELALAETYERSGDVAAVFAPDSPIHDPTYREVLLTNSASAELLRQRATAQDAPKHEKQLALYILLLKELTRGHYQPFVDDLRLMPDPAPVKAGYFDRLGIGSTNGPPLADFSRFGGTHDGYACPQIATVATVLAANPHDEGALICLAEFVRLGGYETFLRQDNAKPKPPDQARPVELSSTASQFPGVGVSRLAIYQTIINDPKAASDVRAYALYRAVRCFAPGGYNECDETQVPQSQRHEWYRQLKTRYRGTTWATRLKFYW